MTLGILFRNARTVGGRAQGLQELGLALAPALIITLAVTSDPGLVTDEEAGRLKALATLRSKMTGRAAVKLECGPCLANSPCPRKA